MKLYKLAGTALLATLTLSACDSDSIDINSYAPPTPDATRVSTPTTACLYEANPLFFAKDNCFNAMAARLDDIKATGTNVLWIMPINTLGEKDAFGSPYCVKDYKGINPKYGDLASFKSLVNAAHGKGMIVILDWIANHTAWDNPWITEHPDWYVQKDGHIVSPSGWSDVAELNYDNAAMRAAMIDALTYWMQQGIDGFRCDHVDGVPHDFWKEAIDAIRKVKADAFMLAESSDLACYDDGFDMIYDWAFVNDLSELFKNKITPDNFAKKINERNASIPEGKNMMRYALNHDVLAENSPADLFGSNDAVEAAYVVAAFTGQAPLIYSGMEAGFTNKTPFIGAQPLTWNADRLAQYKRIGVDYVATETMRSGTMHAYQSGTDVKLFSMAEGDKAIIVAVNPTGNDLQAKMPMYYIGVGMTELNSGSQMLLPGVITVPAYGYKIFMQ